METLDQVPLKLSSDGSDKLTIARLPLNNEIKDEISKGSLRLSVISFGLNL
jgi:hypothetical protein